MKGTKNPGKLNTSFWETAFKGNNDNKTKPKRRRKKSKSKITAMWGTKENEEQKKSTAKAIVAAIPTPPKSDDNKSANKPSHSHDAKVDIITENIETLKEGWKIIVHSECDTFTHFITDKLNEIDDETFDEFVDEIKAKFKIKGEIGKIYEDVSGKRIYCDDWDDFTEILGDKQDDNGHHQVLHLHIESALDTWCINNGFAKCYKKLTEYGFTSTADFAEQSKDDIADLCVELGIKYVVKNRFKQAIKALYNEPEKEKKTIRNLAPGFSIAPHKKTEYIVPKSIGMAAKKLCISWNSMVESGDANTTASISKTILIIGQTGAGKTTLINGMLNYIYNIRYEDNYRLRLIEEKEKECKQAESQTDHVSVYQVSAPEIDSNIEYNLNIIDSPGFGDTRGISKDFEILVDLRYLLDNTLNGIDAVCFVMKSTTNRLTAAQQYVFNNVLNLWAADIEPNMFILLTFCESKKAQIMNSLAQHAQFAHCKNVFQFNNTAYCHDPTKDADELTHQFNKMYWKMSENGFRSFFKALDTTKPKPTTNSRLVLRQRAKIDNKIEIILNEKDNLLRATQNIVQHQKLINKYDAVIMQNQETSQIAKHMDTIKEYQSTDTITTCSHCKKTCHRNCLKVGVKTCHVMNDDACCDVCGCHYTEHESTDYIWIRREISDTTTNWNQSDGVDIKVQYDNAMDNKSQAQNENKILLARKQEIETNIADKMKNILKDFRYLEMNALRPKLSTVGEYIDQVLQINAGLSNETLQRLKRIQKKEDIIYEIESRHESIGKNVHALNRQFSFGNVLQVNEDNDDCIYNEECICICGEPFELILAERCYSGTPVGCDICEKSIDAVDIVYHCPNGKSNAHDAGYDLCFSCVLKEMLLYGGSSDPFCICGGDLLRTDAEVYGMGATVECDDCGEHVMGDETVYHCKKGKDSPVHEEGYDLCEKCAMRQLTKTRATIQSPTGGKLNLDKIWKRFDKDGNGIIDQEELEDLIYGVLNLFCLEREPDMPPTPRAECGPFVKKIALDLKPQIDKNNDGVISREEFELFGEYFAAEYIQLQKGLQFDKDETKGNEEETKGNDHELELEANKIDVRFKYPMDWIPSFYDTWNQCGISCAVLNGVCITLLGDGLYHSVYGNTDCESPNKYVWKIFIKNLAADKYVFIGIASNYSSYYHKYPGSGSDCYGFHSDKKRTFVKNGGLTMHEGYGKHLAVSDVVEMMLDFTDNTLSFKINGKDYGIAVDEIESYQSYNLIVNSYKMGTELMFL